jgi:hypothetical protein
MSVRVRSADAVGHGSLSSHSLSPLPALSHLVFDHFDYRASHTHVRREGDEIEHGGRSGSTGFQVSSLGHRPGRAQVDLPS